MKEYFSHDYYARSDKALVKLRMKLGMEGLGIYWCLVEMLYESEGKIELEAVETIAFDLRIECDRITDVLENYNLFILGDFFFYSESVNKRLALREDKSEKARESANKRWEKYRENKEPENATALRPQSDRYAIKRKEKKKKKKEKRENFAKKLKRLMRKKS
jgi:hypothetical protein